MDQSTVTLIVGGLGIIGTIGGVIAGQYMARSWQREQWLLDKKLDEYRELLNAVTEAFSYFIQHHREGVAQSPEVQERLEVLHAQSLQVIRTRILTAREVEAHSIMNLWADALKAYDHTFEREPFTRVYKKVSNTVVELAVAESGKRDLLDDIIEGIREDIEVTG